jgi:ribonuclease BN (tRNA processing enzyme)
MAGVRVRFLGSGDAFSSGGRLQACVHLEGAGEPMLIDCGATVLAALKRERIDPASIGCVALSHLHGDHFAGLPWLILDGQFNERTRPLVIAGPPQTEERVWETFEALYPGAAAAERPFEVTFAALLPGETARLDPAAVTPLAVAHSTATPSYALRVEYGGRVIAYSGDSEWTEALVEVARGADLFICECNDFDKSVPGHLDYRTLERQRHRLECARMVLTHMSEEMLARTGELDVQTSSDGLVIEL